MCYNLSKPKKKLFLHFSNPYFHFLKHPLHCTQTFKVKGLDLQPLKDLRGCLDLQPLQDSRGYLDLQLLQDFRGCLDHQPLQDSRGCLDLQSLQDSGCLDIQPQKGFKRLSRHPTFIGFKRLSRPPTSEGFKGLSRPPTSERFKRLSRPPTSEGFKRLSRPPTSVVFKRLSQFIPIQKGEFPIHNGTLDTLIRSIKLSPIRKL